jgi:hypothetical protein
MALCPKGVALWLPVQKNMLTYPHEKHITQLTCAFLGLE